ncbi:TonB-linked SusC/RagA family outer membrane protein [Flavobacteriaceae bacterium MAR_2010_105]|nr:TonB-linked SusC/RagA family outer membrane protein [Flavobacteriaceae bacterium MAR_2010_105]
MSKTLSLKLLLFSMVICPLMAFSQQITGTITDGATGLPLGGANIIIKGTTTGTTSDFDGNFSLNVDSFPVTLVISSLGFETHEELVSSARAVNVTLQESATALNEVVITGLGSSVKRSNLANAVSTVSAAELVGNTGQTTVDGALYGKLTGVNIVSASGAPGGGIAMRLRGVSSINGNNQPLFIVDGVYINNVEIPSGLRNASGANRGNEENSANRLSDIDPNDIEKIEVLKGASAAAIYGQLANAGVVIITTKRGKDGVTRFNFGQDVGFTEIANPLGMRNWTADNVLSTFNAAEVALYNQAIASGGLIDYEDVIYGETGLITETKVSVDGGNEKTKFYVGASYRDEEGIIKNTGFDRFSIKANIDHKLSDTFDFSLSSNYIRSSSSRSFTGNENEGGLSYGYTLAFTRPWINLFPDEQGIYPSNPNYTGNPVFVRDKASNEDLNNRFIQGLSVNTKLYNDDTNRVKFVTSFGLDYLSNQTNVYVPETHQGTIASGQNGFIGVGKNGFTNFNSQAILVWNHDAMDGDLGLTTQVGTAYIDQVADLVLSTTTDLIPGQTNLEQGNNQAITQTTSSIRTFGYFAQVEGNYKDRFIATLGYRLDKSTLNGDPNKFYGFPKASMAVNLNNFDFWESETINQFKLRAAYGETGAPAGFGALFTSLNATSIGGNGGSTINPAKGDPNIEPETSTELEFGFDTRLFNRVNFEATYYIRKVNDLILSRGLPTSSGFSTETTNLADLENTGLELSLNVDAFDEENFRWNSGVQFWFNNSEITRLDVPAFAQPGAGFGLGLGTYYIQKGKPVTQLAGTVNGVPTQIGDSEPDFQMSFNNNFTLFKQFDLSFLLHWKKGGDNINLTKLLTDLGGTTTDLDTQAGMDRAGSGFVATRFIEPAGYVRLREVALYYRFPQDIINSFGNTISNVKLGISARNLFTSTDYTGYDPEVSTNGSAGLSSGIDVTPFPSTRQFYFHLNVNF